MPDYGRAVKQGGITMRRVLLSLGAVTLVALAGGVILADVDQDGNPYGPGGPPGEPPLY